MNLYVGNLPYSTDDDELKRDFEAFGTVVSARVMVDKYTSRSRGFGFVEMSSEEEAQAAIEGMNGKDVGGRELRVDKARPPRDYGNE
ncbi:RNA-binding protein [bacterium]|nr:RNA-binding protein [bacterium]